MYVKLSALALWARAGWWRGISNLVLFLAHGDPLTFSDPWLWPAVRPVVVRSWQGHHWLERKRPWCLFHLWAWRRLSIFAEARYGSYLPCTSSSRRWLWILLEEAACHLVQRTKLLWGIWQRRRHDERRWKFVMFIPGTSFGLTSRFFPDFCIRMSLRGCARSCKTLTNPLSSRYWNQQRRNKSTSTVAWALAGP